jgi:hypothetical protein
MWPYLRFWYIDSVLSGIIFISSVEKIVLTNHFEQTVVLSYLIRESLTVIVLLHNFVELLNVVFIYSSIF